MADITEITRRALANKQPTAPSDKIITLLAKEKLARQAMGEMSGVTYAHKIADQWIADATSEDPDVRLPARKELMERVEGRVPHGIAHTGADGGPIQTEDVSAEQIYRRIAGIAERSAEGPAPSRTNGHGGTTH